MRIYAAYSALTYSPTALRTKAISLRAEMDRIRSIPNLAGLAPKVERRLHLRDYRNTPESAYASPTSSPPRKKVCREWMYAKCSEHKFLQRKMSSSPRIKADDPSSPTSSSLHLQMSSPYQVFAHNVGQGHLGSQYKEGTSWSSYAWSVTLLEAFTPDSPLTLLDFSEDQGTPSRAAPRRPQYISQISLSHFGHAEPDFEPMSLDSSPPRQQSFDESAFSDSLPNLPTRNSSSSTQVEAVDNMAGFGRMGPARYRFYGSQLEYNRPLPTRGFLADPAKIQTPSSKTDETGDFSASLATPESLRCSLRRSLDTSSASYGSLGSLSRNSSRSALPHLAVGTLRSAHTSTSLECLDDGPSASDALKDEHVPTVLGVPFDVEDSALERPSEDGFNLSVGSTRSLCSLPSPASPSTPAAYQRSSSPAHTGLSAHTMQVSLPSVVPVYDESYNSIVREESLHDTLHGKLFEGADPWRALDDVLGLQSNQRPPVDGRSEPYDMYQEDLGALVLGPDRELGFSPSTHLGQLEQAAYAELDELNKGCYEDQAVEPLLDRDMLAGTDAVAGEGTQDTAEGSPNSSLADPQPMSLGTQSTMVEEWVTLDGGSHTVGGHESSQCEEAALGESTGTPDLTADMIVSLRCRISVPDCDRDGRGNGYCDTRPVPCGLLTACRPRYASRTCTGAPG